MRINAFLPSGLDSHFDWRVNAKVSKGKPRAGSVKLSAMERVHVSREMTLFLD